VVILDWKLFARSSACLENAGASDQVGVSWVGTHKTCRSAAVSTSPVFGVPVGSINSTCVSGSEKGWNWTGLQASG
jgi:hypothetical protein